MKSNSTSIDYLLEDWHAERIVACTNACVGISNLNVVRAAPDMLEALSEAWGYVLYYVMDPNTQDKDAKEVLQKMDRAIRKAKGKQ